MPKLGIDNLLKYLEMITAMDAELHKLSANEETHFTQVKTIARTFAIHFGMDLEARGLPLMLSAYVPATEPKSKGKEETSPEPERTRAVQRLHHSLNSFDPR